MIEPTRAPTHATPLPAGGARRIFDFAVRPAVTLPDIPGPAELAELLPDYRMGGIVGRGGMGAVYEADQTRLGRRVAIKVLPVSLGDEPGFAERFRREAQTMASLRHPGIVAVHDSGETIAGHGFYVMEFVEGGDLAREMEKRRLSAGEAVRLLTEICDALEFAHRQGIVHRDIKPSNILLTAEGRPKLADFGLALLAERERELSRLTLGGTTLGTLEYAAPEQLDGAAVSPASDLYSLGVLAYELLTGEMPRGIFDPPSARNAGVDPAFDGVVLRALQSDPGRRHSSAAEFAAALQQAADRRLQQERRDQNARQKLRRRTRLAAAAALVALGTLALALFAWQQRRRAREGERTADLRRVAAEKAERETEDVIHFLLTDLRQRLESIGNLGAMEAVLDRAVSHFREKHGAQPGHDTARQLANAVTVKGEVLAVRGRAAEGLELLTEALALEESAQASTPGDGGDVPRVALALQRRGELLLAMERHDEALDNARRFLTEAEKRPQDVHTLATAHRAVADALAALKNVEGARLEYRLGRELLERAAQARPADSSLTAERAGYDAALGSLAETDRDYPLMLQHLTRWHDFVRSTAGTDSHACSESAMRLARAMVLNDRADEAFPLIADAIRIADTEVADRPGHRGRLRHLRECMLVFCTMQDRRGDAGSAAEMRRRLAAVESAIAAAPEDPSVGAEDRAATRLRQTEEKLFAELKTHPEDDEAQFAWAMASSDVGTRAEAIAGIPGAMLHYERQMAKLEPILATAPPDSWWGLGASYTLNRLGELHERTRNWAAAEPIFQRSLAIRRQILAAHPGNHREGRNIVSTATRLARTLVALQRPADAGALWHGLFAELKSFPGHSSFEWRALAIDSVEEILPALVPGDAHDLAKAAAEFLVARGPAELSAAERQKLASLEKLVEPR